MSHTTPQIHTEKIILQTYHCDRTDHLSLWGLCRIFQEASAHHTDGTNISYEALIKEQKAWVLSRMYYEMHQMPSLGEEMTVSTWSRGPNGIFAVREFQMHDLQGNLRCSASTYWVVIDMQARKVCRITDLMAVFPSHESIGTSVESFNKLRLGDFADAERVAIIPANDSFIDHTQHVNNAEYIKLMSDYFDTATLDGQFQQHRFDNTCFQIDYPLETRPAEPLSIYRHKEENTTSFQIKNPRGVSAIALFSFL